MSQLVTALQTEIVGMVAESFWLIGCVGGGIDRMLGRRCKEQGNGELMGGLCFVCFVCGSSFWKAEDDAGMMGLAGGDSQVHPYVSLTVNLAG